MTDWIMLTGLERDRELRRSNTLIDEAHERSFNIDFILGALRPCARYPRRR
jgi:ATP-dependent helicase HrpA